jgi:hypothetical protein
MKTSFTCPFCECPNLHFDKINFFFIDGEEIVNPVITLTKDRALTKFVSEGSKEWYQGRPRHAFERYYSCEFGCNFVVKEMEHKGEIFQQTIKL